MKIKEVACRRWLLNNRVHAITLYPRVYYNMNHPDMFDALVYERVRRHESVHVEQIKKFIEPFPIVLRWLGVLLWYAHYVWTDMIKLMFHRARDHDILWGRYEQEAYNRQHDPLLSMDKYTSGDGR